MKISPGCQQDSHQSDAGPASTTANPKVAWRRRGDPVYGSSTTPDQPSTEGALRALLNKLAPSDTLGSLANQVASHLLEDDAAPERLARQLVERAQIEPLFAATYAKLCSVLVHVRSGFVFYKYLMIRSRTAFSAGVRTVIVDVDNSCPSSSSSRPTVAAGYPNSFDIERHRLRALVEFVCHLFLEGLLCFEQLEQDFLVQLQSHLPDIAALECLCKALSVAGQRIERHRPQWVMQTIHQLQTEASQVYHRDNRHLPPRMLFMLQDLVELQQRNWQPRGEPQLSPRQLTPDREQAEP